MKDFSQYLEQTGEVGFIEQAFQSIVYVKGLPSAKPNEVIMFETGDLGEVISMTDEYVEVLMFSKANVKVGTRAARTDQLLDIPVGDNFLGTTINPLDMPIVGSKKVSDFKERRPIDIVPLGMQERQNVREAFESGITIIDLVIPLGCGQRELVIGDRKCGKTQFLMQAVYSHAKRGGICIYGGIGKRQTDILDIWKFFREKGVEKNVIMVASSSSDPAGLIFLTPYSAMTHAEYFRDQGKDVLIILDDLTIHAKYYREITLLAKRFPGRSSYPGDIFYLHSRLVERAGKFKQGSITCLPVAEAVFGDISGYIQTNLMSMTDGHIFFDHDLYNQGRRPAINHFLSVTRVGHQTQSSLMRDLSRELGIFLVHHDKMRQFMRFGGEVSESVRQTLDLGEKILIFFDQPHTKIIPMNINAVILAGLWAGLWQGREKNEMTKQLEMIAKRYEEDGNFKEKIDGLVSSKNKFFEMVEEVKHLGIQMFVAEEQGIPKANIPTQGQAEANQPQPGGKK